MFFGKWRPRGAKPKMVCVYLVFCAVIFLLHLYESLAGKHTGTVKLGSKNNKMERHKTDDPCSKWFWSSSERSPEARGVKCMKACEQIANEWNRIETTRNEYLKGDPELAGARGFHSESCRELTHGACSDTKPECLCRKMKERSEHQSPEKRTPPPRPRRLIDCRKTAKDYGKILQQDGIHIDDPSKIPT
nr:PREDICTED: uncharacterized protein LOC109042045 isoform X2 [Bemisia tabaci]